MALPVHKVFSVLLFISLMSYHNKGESLETLCTNDTESHHCTTASVDHTPAESSSEYFNDSTVEDGNSTAVTEVDDNTTEPYSTTEVESVTKIPTSESTSTVKTIQTTPETSYEMCFIPEDICTCDLTVKSCDINCCCDEDCSASDRQAFSHCFKRPPMVPDPHYCYQTNFIYHNNTEYKMTENREGLFCILRDNLPKETRYMKRKSVTQLEEFRKLYEKRKIYSWSSSVPASLTFQPVVYRAGSIVWNLMNGSFSPLVLPHNLMSASCETSVPVRYLMDWSDSCSPIYLNCETSEALSALTYYKSLFIIAAPQLINGSQITYFLEQQECLFNACLSFSLYMCTFDTSDDDCLSVDDFEAPTYINKSQMCLNVVKRVKYVFYHNGTQGILKAEAYIWMTTLYTQRGPLSQSFTVNFVWVDSPKKPFRRSGNPGYIIGKPVIAGKKITQISETENGSDKEAILLSSDQSRWLTLPMAGSDGQCKNDVMEGNRISITVGDDLKALCFVELTVKDVSSEENCTSLQKQILHLLLGEGMVNVTEAKEFNLYVSTFGDAIVENLGDWVPVLLENFPEFSAYWKQEGVTLICRNIVSRMHVNIVISKVGLVSRPQIKVLGVAITFGEGEDFVFDCSPWQCSNFDDNKAQRLPVRSSVSFLDVSKPPIIHFAEPPVYEVKLPYDFFYPFLSSKHAKEEPCWHFVIAALWFQIVILAFR